MEAGIGRGSMRDGAPTAGRTRVALILCAIALALATLALGALASPPPASAISPARTLTIRTVTIPRIGTVLATASGHTLYHYSGASAGKVTCTAVCAKVWPPFLLPKGVIHLKAAHGVKGLSVIRIKGGRLEVFFHHEALYTFVSDTKEGQARGQGVENKWFAVLADGTSSSKSVTAAASSAAGTSTTTPTTNSASGSAPKATSPSLSTSSTPTPLPMPSSTSSSINATRPATPPVSPPASQAPPTSQPPTTTQEPSSTEPTTTTTTAPPTGGFGF